MTIRKSVTVACPPEKAFRAFTREIGRWWPIARGFSYGGERRNEIFLDDHVGGRLYERFTDGSEFEIGRVTRVEPPHLILFTWTAPDWEAATEVEVRFAPADGGTRVELEHRGFEAGPKTRAAGEGMGRGWPIVLAQYREYADKEPDRGGSR